MTIPNQEEEILMKAYEDAGYWVWWNGYDITSNTTEDVRAIIVSLVKKGWRKGC
jgi:hypothetical protein